MKAHCPNCEMAIEATAKSCGYCGAKFGAGGWQPVTAHDSATNSGALEMGAIVAAGAGLFAWLFLLVTAVLWRRGDSWFSQGGAFSLRSLWRSFVFELQVARLALALALLAVLIGLIVLALSRARLVPWTGLVTGGILLAIAAPGLGKNPYLRPLLEVAGLKRPIEIPKFVPMNDGRWWDCGPIMRGKFTCAPDSAVAIQGLLPYERALLDKFDALPKPPAAIGAEQIIALMGKPPRSTNNFGGLSTLEWPGTSPEAPEQGKLAITIAWGQLYEIQWIEPKRFFLQKINEIKQTAPEGAKDPKEAKG